MENKIVVIAIVIFIFFSLCPQVTAASTIAVPNDSTTIQEAIDAAVVGDTVVVGPGNRERTESLC